MISANVCWTAGSNTKEERKEVKDLSRIYTIEEGDNYCSIIGDGLEFQISTDIKLYILQEVRKAIRKIVDIKKEIKNERSR